MNGRSSLPLEDFIQAITSQLDRTQMSMALKAKAGLPLTFAVKDLSMDLRAHVDVEGGAVTIRPAGPGDGEASTLHLELTTITRPMIEENTRQLAAASSGPSIRDVLGDDLTDEDERRLEWVGIQDVAQYRRLEQSGGNRLVEKVAPRPIDKLRMALEAAGRPRIDTVETVGPRFDTIDTVGDTVRPRFDTIDTVGDTVRPRFDTVDTVGPRPPAVDRPARLLLRGSNLRGPGGRTRVRLDGEDIPVLRAADDHLLVQPLAHHDGGTIEVETVAGVVSVDVNDESAHVALADDPDGNGASDD